LMSMSGGVKTNSTREASGKRLSAKNKPDPRYNQETNKSRYSATWQMT
jgi:hypothetical protein